MAVSGGGVEEGAAGVQRHLLPVPIAAHLLQAARQALQEDPRRHLPRNTGVWKNKLEPESKQLFDFLPPSIQEQLLLERDPHGNVQVAKIETEKMLITMVETELEKRKAEGKYKGHFIGQSHFFGYEGSFDIDGGLQTADFIKDAVKKLPALRPLCMILKVSLHRRELNEVYTGGIGSYALLTMLITHLQLVWGGKDMLGYRRSKEHNSGILLVMFFLSLWTQAEQLGCRDILQLCKNNCAKTESYKTCGVHLVLCLRTASTCSGWYLDSSLINGSLRAPYGI